jgi:hypothetical protein
MAHSKFNIADVKELAEVKYWASYHFLVGNEQVSFESVTGYAPGAPISAKDIFQVAEKISNMGFNVMIHNLRLDAGGFRRILWVDDQCFRCR